MNLKQKKAETAMRSMDYETLIKRLGLSRRDGFARNKKLTTFDLTIGGTA